MKARIFLRAAFSVKMAFVTNRHSIPQQPTLSFARIFSLTWQGMRVRLRQSVLTLLTIAMAVAFVTHVWLMNLWEPLIRVHEQMVATDSTTMTQPSSGPGMTWLIGLSLLMAAVGITNAILMSVVERYREIGTMKCLGALDSFILSLFMLESAILGAAGSIAGVMIGLILVVISLVSKHGGTTWDTFPLLSILGICAVTFLTGMGMTTLAALYPARKAARMDPIAAMRTEV